MHHGLIHELGHIWDWRTLTDADHAEYASLTGWTGDWWTGLGPAEHLADDYARCGFTTFRPVAQSVCDFIRRRREPVSPALPAPPTITKKPFRGKCGTGSRKPHRNRRSR